MILKDVANASRRNDHLKAICQLALAWSSKTLLYMLASRKKRFEAAIVSVAEGKVAAFVDWIWGRGGERDAGTSPGL
jgi:hypothetical protein